MNPNCASLYVRRSRKSVKADPQRSRLTVDVVDADVQVLPEGWQVRVAATGARVDRREGGSGAAAESHAGFGLAVLRSWKNITDEWDKFHGRQFETVPDENRHLQNALDNFTSF
jgi:hypothetical protein